MKKLIELLRKDPTSISKQDFCRVFNIDSKKIHYLIYRYPEKKRYKNFTILRKNGKERLISTPIHQIKQSQKKLVEIINNIYQSKPSSFAYSKNKDIKKHAEFHFKKDIKCILRIDIQDFFSSIHFGRIVGVFSKVPFLLNKDVAQFLSNICCYNKCLPQGAPTSPILSDLVCRKLDNQLKKLAKQSNCFYTRYADDIYFSTRNLIFSKLIGTKNENNNFMLSENIKKIFTQNTFKINDAKTYFMDKSMRQVVTGVVINKKLTPSKKYIKLIRSMLHTWESKGLEYSQRHFQQHYNHNRYDKNSQFSNFLIGRISHLGYIRGVNDRIYLKYAKRLSELFQKDDNKNLSKKFHYTLECKDKKCDCRKSKRLVRQGNYNIFKKHILEIKNSLYTCKLSTEGETDLNYIKAALSHFHRIGEFLDFNIDFSQSISLEGDAKLKTHYYNRHYRINNKCIEICLFDNDSQVSRSILNNSRNKASQDRDKFSNCFPLITPYPKHRDKNKEFCIELYFLDKDLLKNDEDNKRIYLREEFNNDGKHKEIEQLQIYKEINQNRIPNNLIVEKVINSTNTNIARSKAEFANYILKESPYFDNIDFSNFSILFEEMIKIIKHNI